MPSLAKAQPPLLLGSDSARVQLRNALTTYLHQLDPPAPMGYHHWAPAGLAARPCPTLLVGDPIVLSVTPPSSPPHIASSPA